MITAVYPGSGITIFTYPSVPLKWWRVYAQLAQLYIDESEATRGK